MERGKYNEVKDEVISYIREGDTVKMACKKAGIIRDTFYRWQRDKPEFDEALKKARKEFRETIVQTLEQSLWKRAAGYEVEEVKNEYRTLKDGSKVLVSQAK